MAAVHLGVLSLPHHYLACQRPPRYRRVRRTVRIQRDTSERNDPARDAPTTVEVGNAVRAPTTPHRAARQADTARGRQSGTAAGRRPRHFAAPPRHQPTARAPGRSPDRTENPVPPAPPPPPNPRPG